MTSYQPFPASATLPLPTRLVRASAPALDLQTEIGLQELGIPGTTPAGTWPEDYRATPRLAAIPISVAGTISGLSTLSGTLRPVNMTPEMAAAIEAGLAYWLIEIDAAGISERAAEVAGYASAEGGLYTGRLSSVGPWTEPLSGSKSALSSISVPCELQDDDGAFATLVGGRYGVQLRNATARVKLAAPTVAFKSWFLAFSGVLLAIARGSGLKAWQISLGTDELPLKRKAPRRTFQRALCPKADPAIYGKVIPFVLGTYDSSSTTGKGALPTFEIDTVLHRHAWALGVGQGVDRVFVGGVPLAAAGWTATSAEFGGVRISYVELVADPVDAAVTVDARGLTDVFDGSGALVEDPVGQFELALRLIVWNDWSRGAYPAASTVPADADTFALAQDYLLRRTISGGLGPVALHVSAQQAGRDFIKTWCESMQIRCAWSGTGKLRLVADDDPEDPYQAEHFDEAEVEIGERAALDFDSTSALDSVQVQYLPDPAGGKRTATLTIQDTSLGETGADTLDLVWSRGGA